MAGESRGNSPAQAGRVAAIGRKGQRACQNKTLTCPEKKPGSAKSISQAGRAAV